MKKLILLLDKILKFNIHKDFTLLFFKRESVELIGKKKINFWILITILFFTFIAIGFANGSLKYLNIKMSDPFVNWVNIDVPYSKNDIIYNITNDLNTNDKLKKDFHYKSAKGYNHYALRFTDKTGKNTRTAYGRTIDSDNELLTKIFNKDNLIVGKKFRDEKDIGLIVTNEFLKRFDYDKTTSFALMAFSVSDQENDRIIPIPIIAVVKELPGISTFMTTNFLYKQRIIPRKENPFNPEDEKDLIIISYEDSINSYKLLKNIENFLKTNPKYNKLYPYVQLYSNLTSQKKCFEILVNLKDENLTIADYDLLFKEIVEIPSINKFQFDRFFNYNSRLYNQSDENIVYDKISIEFVDLAKIRDFKDFIASNYEIQIDMAQIEALENYNFITKLTRIISLILIGFSILSICMFISNILKKHLEKIKMNIGTFKAFGIKNKSLGKIYITIIFLFVALSMFISIFLAGIIGYLGGIRLVLNLIRSNIEENQNYFELLNYWTLISVLSVLLISFFVLRHTTYKILSKTPGDLIYDR